MKRIALTVALTLGFAASVSTSKAQGLDQTCFIGLPCDDGLFCQSNECFVELQGKCIKIPTVCSEVSKPVCGCDLKDYANDCKRQMAKVTYRSLGKCKGNL